MLGKPNQKSLISSTVGTLAQGTGMAVGGAVGNLIPIDDKTARNAIVAVGGIVLTSAISGKSKQEKIIKSLAQGVATRGVFDLVSGQIQSSIEISDEDTLLGKAARGALGLNAPDYPALAAPVTYLPPRNPIVTWDDNGSGSSNTTQSGKMLEIA